MEIILVVKIGHIITQITTGITVVTIVVITAVTVVIVVLVKIIIIPDKNTVSIAVVITTLGKNVVH